MKIKKTGAVYFIRLDKGEEIITSLKKFCAREKLRAGFLTGLGAVGQAELGLFECGAKRYRSRKFAGDHEVVSLTGNISTLDGEIYLHLHAALGDSEQRLYGGHLNSAVISATGEIAVVPAGGELSRFFDQDTGLNLLDL